MYSIPIGFRFRDATRCQRLWLIAFCAASQTAARAAAVTCGTLTLQLQFNRNFSAQIEEFSPRHFFLLFLLNAIYSFLFIFCITFCFVSLFYSIKRFKLSLSLALSLSLSFSYSLLLAPTVHTGLTFTFL